MGGNLQMGGGYSSMQGGRSGSYEVTTTTNNYSSEAINSGLLATTAALANQKVYANSFESARVETAQRLEGLASKVQAAMNNLNYKLEMFNSEMVSVVTEQYNVIKEKIYQVVEETFRNS